MALNRDVIELCRRISGMAEMAQQYRNLAAPLPKGQARDDLFRQASAIDDEMCAECSELRRLCREPYGFAS